MRRLALIFALFLYSLSPSAVAQTTIDIFGDSRSTLPPSVPGSFTWPQFITEFDSSLASATIINHSYSGETCQTLLANYVPYPLAPPAERIGVIKCSMNDFVAGRTPAQAYADIIAIRTLLLQDKAKPIIFAEACNRTGQAWCDALNNLIKREDVSTWSWYGIVRVDLFCRDHSDPACYITEYGDPQVHDAIPFAKIEARLFTRVLNREPIDLFPQIALGCADVPTPQGNIGKIVHCGNRNTAKNGYDLFAGFDFQSGCETWLYWGPSTGELSASNVYGPCATGMIWHAP